MVAAYLRGLLPKNHKYRSRSIASEEIILEAISAELLARNIEIGAEADLALIPVLTEKGINQTVERTSARLQRAAELRTMDIYRVSEQLSGKIRCDNTKNELSLYQVYQIADKTGIFESFDRHYTEEDATPLL